MVSDSGDGVLPGIASFLLPKVTVETPTISREFLTRHAYVVDFIIVPATPKTMNVSASPLQIYASKITVFELTRDGIKTWAYCSMRN